MTWSLSPSPGGLLPLEAKFSTHCSLEPALPPLRGPWGPHATEVPFLQWSPPIPHLGTPLFTQESQQSLSHVQTRRLPRQVSPGLRGRLRHWFKAKLGPTSPSHSNKARQQGNLLAPGPRVGKQVALPVA